MQTTVRNCPHCEGSHTSLEVHEIEATAGPWTHWANCPVVKAPFMMRWTADDMPVDAEVVEKMAETLGRCGSMLVMVAGVWDDRVQMYWKTHLFPKAKLLECADHFRLQMLKEVGDPNRQEELSDAVNVPPSPFRVLAGAEETDEPKDGSDAKNPEGRLEGDAGHAGPADVDSPS